MAEPARTVAPALSRAEAEDLLFFEAMLIDERRFDEWLVLFTADGLYWVPCGQEGDDLDPERHVSIVYDHAPQRALRVERLQHRHSWNQDPPPRVAHLVTNVIVLPPSHDRVEVRSNQLISVARLGSTTLLPARCSHVLRREQDRWGIAGKTIWLLGSDHYLSPDTITLL